MGQNQIHTRHQAVGTEEQCRCASSFEGHDECSDWEDMQPVMVIFKLVGVFIEY